MMLRFWCVTILVYNRLLDEVADVVCFNSDGVLIR